MVITSGSVKCPLSTYTGNRYPRAIGTEREEQGVCAWGYFNFCRNLYILAHTGGHPRPGVRNLGEEH